jgi:hypothetical protein
MILLRFIYRPMPVRRCKKRCKIIRQTVRGRKTAIVGRLADVDVPRGTDTRRMFHVKPRGRRLQSAAVLGKRMARILCLGMSALDAIYRVSALPTAPVKILATGFRESGGGMAANASVAVARLGSDVEYWGRLGADALGDRILAALAAEGVGIEGVRRVAGCTSPSAAVLVAPDGERLVCAYNDPALDRDASWLPTARVGSFAAVLADVRWPEGRRRYSMSRALPSGLRCFMRMWDRRRCWPHSPAAPRTRSSPSRGSRPRPDPDPSAPAWAGSPLATTESSG